MIELNPQLSEELDLTYWQLIEESAEQQVYTINREEKELLRKVLLAKGIEFKDDIIEVQEYGVVIVSVNNHQLIFDDVNISDSKNIIHLAKISEMLNSVEKKKHTWYKLKNIELY